MAENSAFKYRAFLSYSHTDTPTAKRLHKRLEGYPIDADLAGRATDMGPVPRTLRPIFRDREEFAAGQSLGEQTLAALENSAALIVLCSPASAKSHYVNEEVRLFKSRHPGRPVIPVIADVTAADAAAECFPPALRFEVGADGAVTANPTSALAADLREAGDGEELALAKVVARLVGRGTDDVFRRAQRQERQRQRRWIAGLSAVAITLAGLGLYAEVNRRAAELNLAVAKQGADAVIFDIAQSLRDQEGMRVETVRKILGSAERSIEALVARSRSHSELLRSQAAMLIEFADTYGAQGDAERQEEAVEKSMAILDRLLASEPQNADWRSDRAVVTSRSGDVLLAKGLTAEALARFRQGLAAMELLSARGVVTQRLEHNMAAAHDRIANVLYGQGLHNEALRSYEQSRVIIDRIAAADLGNLAVQRESSVLHFKIGNALAASGKAAEAVATYRKGLALLDRLAAADPGNARWQSDIAITHSHIAKALASQGQWPEAVKSFGESLAILDRLAKSDPGNTERQRNLASTNTSLADALVATGKLDDALAVHNASLARLTAQRDREPSNTMLQQLWGAAQSKIGDVLLAQQKPAEALVRYRESLKAAEGLVAKDAENAARKSDLATAHTKTGEALQALGKLEEALKSYSDCIAISERLSAQDPASGQYKGELAQRYGMIGIVLVLLERRDEARETFVKARTLITSLIERGANTDMWRALLANIDKLMAAL